MRVLPKYYPQSVVSMRVVRSGGAGEGDKGLDGSVPQIMPALAGLEFTGVSGLKSSSSNAWRASVKARLEACQPEERRELLCGAVGVMLDGIRRLGRGSDALDSRVSKVVDALEGVHGGGLPGRLLDVAEENSELVSRFMKASRGGSPAEMFGAELLSALSGEERAALKAAGADPLWLLVLVSQVRSLQELST
jgi:hypothetical protein